MIVEKHILGIIIGYIIISMNYMATVPTIVTYRSILRSLVPARGYFSYTSISNIYLMCGEGVGVPCSHETTRY